VRAVPRRLLAALIDDAALFPPGNAPMTAALKEHEHHRHAWYAGFIGPFVCPARRLDELLAALPADQHLDLALVVDRPGDEAHAALRAAAADDRISLVAVEAAHAVLGDDAGSVGATIRRLPSVVGFLEVDRDHLRVSLDLVGPAGWHAAKLRTGGATAAAFPTDAQVADFLVETADRGLQFKLTAGLHHAVRHTDGSTGFEQHGLLNLLVATADVLAREDREQVVATLAERAPEPLVDRVRSWSELDCLAIRGSFRSFGCCGVTEPIEELVALGVVEEQ